MLWLWHRLAATAPIRPLAWEPPYAVGAALEKVKRQKIINKKIKETTRDNKTHKCNLCSLIGLQIFTLAIKYIIRKTEIGPY